MPDDGGNGYLTTTLPNPLVPTMTQLGNNLNFYEAAANGTTDVEPDLFSFNFGGYSGKFVFDATASHNIKLIPYQNIKIVTTDYNTWTATTPDGTIYTFGGTAIDNTTTTGINNSSSFNSAWHLTSIKTPNEDDVITFTYESYGSSNIQTSYSRDFKSAGSSSFCAGYQGSVSPLSTAISGKNIKTITSLKGKVVFTYASNSDVNGNTRLTTIAYYGHDQTTLLKSYNLEQSYYISGTQKRLRLDKVKEIGSDGSFKPPYEFTYLDTGIYTLPQQQSFAQDHWGFYNGADGNTTLLPAILANPLTINAQSGADRNPTREYTKAGIIQKIAYPTGGYTTFDFECHEFEGSAYATEVLPIQLPTESIAGGLRIKEIKSFDGTQTTVKKYAYKKLSNAAQSSGVLMSTILYSYNSYEFATGGNGCYGAEYECPRFGQSSSSTVPLSLGQGSHVVYPEVTEYIGQNGEFGKTEYTFSNMPDVYSVNYAIPVITSYDFARGLLLKKEDFNFVVSTSTYVKVQKTENIYWAFW